MSIPFDLRALEAFVRVAEMGNISHAAIGLGLTQSSLSRTIAGLERAVGTSLFRRTGRGVQLSEAGEAILGLARNVVVSCEQIRSEVGQRGSELSGVVTLALPPSVMRDVAAELYHEVRERHPGVTLRMLEGFSPQLENWLADGRADIAVLSRYRKSDVPAGEVVVESQMVLAGVKVPGTGPVRFRDVARLPLLLPAAPNVLRMALEQAARRMRVRLNVVAEADSLEAQRAILLRDACFTVVSRETVRREVERGELRTRPIVQPRLPRFLVLATTTQRPLGRAAREVATITGRLVARR
jgi:LysR family nitrogen assimilation transcriptional regulator